MDEKEQALTTHQKAIALNFDKGKYGSIAEIGAGQETARWFFSVGGAAGTIAKATSAYDMQVSDSIYGPCQRYVSRERLEAMVDREYTLLVDRLGVDRGDETTFFSFANTVATRSFVRQQNGHGWLGIRFQTQPRGEPSQIDLHVNLKGKESIQDQETLGILGVNLIYAAMHYQDDPEKMLLSLLDDLSSERFEVDLVDFSGPAYEHVDNRLMALRLVQHGLSRSAMFQSDGKVVQPADILYKKSVLIERSRFRPPTKLNMQLLDSAYADFCEDPNVDPERVLVLSEMTLHNLSQGDDIDAQDFLSRADILCALGKHVMISDYGEFYRLAGYLFQHTQMPIGVALGIPTLLQIFDENYYSNLEGGILESFGRLFKNDLRFYVCPAKDQHNGDLHTVDNLPVAENLRHLYQYLRDNGSIRALTTVDESYLNIFSHTVLEKIQNGDNSWESLVPETVVEIIRGNRLFGCL